MIDHKEIIFTYIKENPATHINEIIKKLKISKTTLSRDVMQLLEEKRIILLSDSHNLDFKGIFLSRKQQQLVFYDEIKEKQGELMLKEPLKPLKRPDDLKSSLYKTTTRYKKILADFKNSNESEKKIKAPLLKIMSKLYNDLQLECKKFDNRTKHTEWEKMMIAYSVNGHYSINQMSRLERVSKKHIRNISKKYPVTKDDPRYPEFKKMLGNCDCGYSIADNLIEKSSQ